MILDFGARPRGGPAATAIVVNYNSSPALDVVSESLRATLRLAHRPLEVVVVDNGSSDGSFDRIREIVEAERPPDLFVRLVRLGSNLGFARANTIGYRLRSPASRYVALINNDLAPEPDSLTLLIKYLEAHPRLAGVQGLIAKWDGTTTDSYGIIITDKWTYVPLMPAAGSRPRPVPVTYLHGAYSVYKVEALEKCGGLFLPYFFMYGDDHELGIRLWRCGYALAAVPVRAGRHRGGTTLRRLPQINRYYSLYSNVAVAVMYDNPLRAVFSNVGPAFFRGPGVRGALAGLKLRRAVRWRREARAREPLRALVARKASRIRRRKALELLRLALSIHRALGLAPDPRSVAEWSQL